MNEHEVIQFGSLIESVGSRSPRNDWVIFRRSFTGSTSKEQHPVSAEASCWALNLAPVPADREGQRVQVVFVGLRKAAGHRPHC
jgi:hypothetical protein